MIELPQDFRDVLLALHAERTEFVVVGGHAVAFHGHPRATRDLDILVRATRANAKRVYQALAVFGAPLSAFEVGEDDFATYDGVLQLGVPPLRIDIINRADGISFDEAIADHASFEIEGHEIPIIGCAALIKNKRASGRAQDLADVVVLARITGVGSRPR
jgi:hypothetical protein